MSRIGNMPVTLPSGVDVDIDGSDVTVKGAQGILTYTFHSDMTIERSNGAVVVKRPSDEAHHRALHGLTRSLIANMVTGVSEGFAKSLELVGVGYRVQQNGKGIMLNVMYSHPRRCSTSGWGYTRSTRK